MGLLSERGPGVDFADRDHTASHGAAIKGAEIPLVCQIAPAAESPRDNARELSGTCTQKPLCRLRLLVRKVSYD